MWWQETCSVQAWTLPCRLQQRQCLGSTVSRIKEGADHLVEHKFSFQFVRFSSICLWTQIFLSQGVYESFPECLPVSSFQGNRVMKYLMLPTCTQPGKLSFELLRDCTVNDTQLFTFFSPFQSLICYILWGVCVLVHQIQALRHTRQELYGWTLISSSTYSHLKEFVQKFDKKKKDLGSNAAWRKLSKLKGEFMLCRVFCSTKSDEWS